MLTRIIAALVFVVCWLTPAELRAVDPQRHPRVFLVILENTDMDEALEQPFLKELATQGALLTNYFAERHPSYPNYLALTSGNTWGIDDDHVTTLDVRHIGNLLEESGKSWKSYAKDYPGNCYLGKSNGDYVSRHEPFLSYKNVQQDPHRCARVVPSSQFKDDMESGNLPDYALYVPNNDENGHDTDVEHADKWMRKHFEPLLKDARFTRDLLFIVTFDEGGLLGDNRVYTVLWGDRVASGARSKARYDHYSLLHTIEDVLGVGTLGEHDASAPLIQGIWK